MEAPDNMQGIVMGLFWFCAGVGNFIGAALPYLFSDIWAIWKNSIYINCDRLDLFFYILAVFLLFFSIVFVLIAKYTDLGLTNVIGDRRPTSTEPDSRPSTPNPRRRRLATAVNTSSDSDDTT